MLDGFITLGTLLLIFTVVKNYCKILVVGEAGQTIHLGNQPVSSTYVIESVGSMFILPQTIPTYGIIVGFTGTVILGIETW